MGNCFSAAVHGIGAGFSYARKHWRGSLQLVGFGACLVVSVGTCMIVGVIGAVAEYIGDSRRDHNWLVHIPAAIANVGLSLGVGWAGHMLEGGKGIESFPDLYNSPWARFGKHSFPGGWRAGGFDYVGNAVLLGARAYIGLLAARGAPEPDPTPGGQG